MQRASRHHTRCSYLCAAKGRTEGAKESGVRVAENSVKIQDFLKPDLKLKAEPLTVCFTEGTMTFLIESSGYDQSQKQMASLPERRFLFWTTDSEYLQFLHTQVSSSEGNEKPGFRFLE